MASEDVLERAEIWLADNAGKWRDADRAERLVTELVAEARELRKDKARLDWMLRNTNDDILSRVDLDAAMGETQND